MNFIIDILPYLFAALLISSIIFIWYCIIMDRIEAKKEKNHG